MMMLMMMKRSKRPTVVVAWTVLLIVVVSLLLAARVYRRQNITESEEFAEDQEEQEEEDEEAEGSPLASMRSHRRRGGGGHFAKPKERLRPAEEQEEAGVGVERQRDLAAAAAAAVGDDDEAGAGAGRSGALPLFDPNRRHHAELNGDGEEEAAEEEVGFANRHPEHSTLHFLLTPRDSVCSDDHQLMMVIFSRPEGRGSRSAIRKTWAKFDSTRHSSTEIKWFTVFVMGTTRSEWLRKEVEEESDRHGDILQGDLEDGLFEDTSKFMLTLKWLLATSTAAAAAAAPASSSSLRLRCAEQLRFVIKSVDNIFHNMDAITGWLKAKYPPATGGEGEARDRGLYVGKLLRRDAPIRDRAHPLFVARDDFGAEVFPDLIQGPVYLFSFDSLLAMGQAMGRVKPIAMEDGYVGLLARSSRIQPKHNDHFQMLTHISDGCHHLRMFFIYDILPNDHIVISKDIATAKRSGKCAAPDAEKHGGAYRHVEA